MKPGPGSGEGTVPSDGRKPTTPQNAAGLRSDPPMSLPSANASIPLARAAAAPPLLPPTDFDGSWGFRVTPKIGLKVCEPAPNSGTFVFPMTSAPASRSRFT